MTLCCFVSIFTRPFSEMISESVLFAVGHQPLCWSIWSAFVSAVSSWILLKESAAFLSKTLFPHKLHLALGLLKE